MTYSSLLLRLTLLVTHTLAKQWRYSHWNIGSFDLLTYKSPVTMETYEDNVTWSTNGCISTEKNVSQDINFVCHSPGFHRVEWTVYKENQTSSHTVWVPLENTPYCYSWKMSYINVSPGISLAISVWIDDLFSYQNIPPKILTEQFWSLGEHPRIIPLTSLSETTIHSLGFNRTSSCWEFVLSGTSLPNIIPLQIDSTGVIIMNCGVRPTTVMATRPKYHIDSVISETPLESALINNTYMQLFTDSNTLSVAIATQGAMNIITQDGFISYASFQINGFTADIQEVVYTSDTICILIGGEIITLINGINSVTWPTGINQVNINHITGREKYVAYNNNDVIVAWSHLMNSVHVSSDGGRSFEAVSLPTSWINYHIHCVRVHPVKDQITLLMNDTASNVTAAIFLYYDLNTQIWYEGDRSFYYDGQQLTMNYFPSSFGDMLIWGRQTIYYSHNGGDTVMSLDLLQRQSDDSLSQFVWNSDEYFITAVTGKSGQFVALTSQKSLLYGRISTGQVVQISTPCQHNDTATSIFFDSLGNLKCLDKDSIGNFTMVTIPVYAHLLTTMYPPYACPYIQWRHNLYNDLYYLDKNETIKIWVSLVPKEWSSNNISLMVSELGVVRWAESSVETQTAVLGSVKRNTTITLYPEQKNSSYTVIRIAPSSHSLSCDKLAEIQADILVTCPPRRHIKIRREDSSCDKYENYTYTISKNYYDPEFKGRINYKATADKTVLYDVTSWGCPIKVPYNKNYKPVLLLYDGNNLKSEVEVDFVLREIHGRTDIGYSATAKDVGCIRSPQTWTEMLAVANRPELAWTPQTYESCFEGANQTQSMSSGNSNTPYEILSRHGLSAVQWERHNGMYVFAATVVAKNYSFCNLTIVFAVEVYGATTKSYLGYVLLLLTCVLTAVGLVLSYFVYRQMLKTGMITNNE